MRSRSRELNPFSMSMLDVIAGAMGAFLIIMVVLLPYYRRDHIDYERENAVLKQELTEIRDRSETVARQVETARAEAARSTERARIAEAALARTFLVVYVRWGTQYQDVDMHLINPAGAEFSYRNKIIPGQPGEFSEDSQIGPGNEVWEIAQAPPGDYRVYANLYDEHNNRADPIIKGKVFYRDGSTPLPATTLTMPGIKVPMATIRVHEDGSVTVHSGAA